ncbi:protein ABHD11 [Artemisia annua]|nr:protein ABHD11 [Artemisia annua]
MEDIEVLDAPPGKAGNNSQFQEVKKALLTLKTIPNNPVKRIDISWLVDHLTSLGLSKFLSEWFGSSLKKSGEHETFSFNIDGAIDMFESVV